MTESECRYAQIEKECLGLVFGLERFHGYVYGLPNFTVETDHRPLIAIIKKNLNEMSPRIQRLMMKLQRYDFDLIYTPGKYLVLADALSRAPASSCVSSTDEDVDVHVNMVSALLPVSDTKSKQIAEETVQDTELQAVIENMLNGWPAGSCPQYYHIRALPTATLTVEPRWSPVFTGESVTLKCETQSLSNWRYQWYKGSSGTAVSQPQTNTFTIGSAADQDQDQYWCRGERANRPKSSQLSNPVTLRVKEKPKPELTSSHKGAALIGNPVVLYCKLDQSAGWRFYWSKHTQSPENETKTETHSYTISSVSVSDGGQYWCRAGRGTPVYYTHYSDALWINVTGTTRSDSLTVSPSRAQHFSADSLSLSCEEQSDSTGWRVRRYTHSEKVSDCSSGLGSVTGSTCNISSLSTSHTGVYWCESESGESSNPVNITVTNGAVILDSPVHPVTEGDPLTLRCLYRDPKPSNLTAEFYKNGSLLQTQTTGETTIRTVSKSDEGLYHCKHPEKGESPQSWISVRGSDSKTVILPVSVVLSLVLILIIILGLFWCYKKKKGDQQNTNQTPDQSQSPGSTQLQTDSGPEPGDVTYAQIELKDKKKPKKTQDKLLEDDSAAGSGDLTYAQVKTKKKKSRGKATPSDEVTYSQIAMKSLKQDSKDSGPEPGDVIYAQIDLKEKKKPKKTQNKLRGGKSREEADTVYSELKN
ncbi:hypothetical protein SRHO_G00028850 [Serrasalmus rhombeus]